MTVVSSLALLLVSCGPAATDTADPSSGPGELSDVHTHAAFVSVADDYSVGSLGTVDLDTWDLSDQIFDVSGDPQVVVTEGMLVQMDRSSDSTIRIYDPADLATPQTEFALAVGANPMDAAICADRLFITQYDLPSIAVHDPETGVMVGSIELTAWDDGDGSPEASAIVPAGNERLFVGLNNLDRSGSWTGIDGHLLEIDCSSLEISGSWEPGLEVTVFPYAPDADKVLVRVAGSYDGSQGGGAYLFDAATRELGERVLDESSMAGQAMTGFAAHQDHAVVFSFDTQTWADYTIGCIDLSDWSYSPIEITNNYLLRLEGNDRGEAWMAARPHWGDSSSVGGLRVFDIDSCSERTGQTWITPVHDPYDVAFF